MKTFTSDELAEITRATGAHVLPPSFVSNDDNAEPTFVYASTGRSYPQTELDRELPCRLCEQTNASSGEVKARNFEHHLLEVHGETIARYLEAYGSSFPECTMIPEWSDGTRSYSSRSRPRYVHTTSDVQTKPQRSALPA